MKAYKSLNSKPDARNSIGTGDPPQIGQKPAVTNMRRRARSRPTVFGKPKVVWKHARAMSDATKT